MRHHRLFTAGLAAALILGAGVPAFAKSDNGKGHGKDNAPGQTKPHPPKGPKPSKNQNDKTRGVSGGGSIGAAEFSIQARIGHLGKGHFNYSVADNPTTPADETFKIHCHDGVQALTPTGNTATVTFNNCQITGLPNGAVTVAVVDAGQHPTPPAVDTISVSYGTVVGTAVPLTGGNVKVR